MSFQPKKSLGQNFLTDVNLSRWIADQIEPQTAACVIEIGPGQGALTAHLADRCENLVLVEKDNELAPALVERFSNNSRVRVMHADATRLDLRPFYRFGDVRIIGNLPYSVGGEVLKAVLTPATPIRHAVFMLQKEVCDRLAANVGDDGYGGLSLLVQQHWDVKLLRIVPPDVFKPRPKVDSAVVKFTPREPGSLPVYDRPLFDRLVRQGFSQRRKQLKNLLPDAPDGWEALVNHLGVPLTIRAEELSLQQWVELTRFYEGRQNKSDAGQKATEMFDVVDENNRVIGQQPRGKVHAEGLRHRAVHIFVLNKRGDIYLQKRSHLKDVHPLVWDSSAAGHLDVGESYATCAIRELEEEIGIRVPETEKLADIPATERTGMEFVELHLARHDGPVHYAPDEIDCGTWFPPPVVDEWVDARPEDFASGFIECWRAWRSASHA
ncbi:MAG: ribosomal RNA small subunit methyltransferase A [Verrucomicrobiaceae bacterium]|nr:ribosomal RNA small subunit methyltransferase A [Verrucomicrobiaceae bacterium]